MNHHIFILVFSSLIAAISWFAHGNSFALLFPIPSLLPCAILALSAYFIYEKEFTKNNNNKENAL